MASSASRRATETERPGGLAKPVALTPIKILRGSSGRTSIGVSTVQWCDDFNVSVGENGVYLLAMKGQDIQLAIPLVVGQEKAGVRAFLEHIGEPQLWE